MAASAIKNFRFLQVEMQVGALAPTGTSINQIAIQTDELKQDQVLYRCSKPKPELCSKQDVGLRSYYSLVSLPN